MRILVTGCAGFIGNAVCLALQEQGHDVAGVDNLCNYYDVELKWRRLERLGARFKVWLSDIVSPQIVRYVTSFQPEVVIHLAAQAGVRYAMQNPSAYVQSNLVGFGNVLEACRHAGVAHLIYASSSSVYGHAPSAPMAETLRTDSPLSLYGATKKANEVMAHSYSSLFNVPTTGLRFFTVYGPWGRPDMALFKFVKAILADEPVELYNGGDHRRDFTYIDDIVAGIVALIPHGHGAKVLNIGHGQPVPLTRYLDLIEETLGKKAARKLLPLQPADVSQTWADTSALRWLTGYEPTTPVEVGVPEFVRWYRSYYQC